METGAPEADLYRDGYNPAQDTLTASDATCGTASRAFGSDGVIAAMTVRVAGLTLFFDVGQLTAGRHFAIPADDASAIQGSKSQEPHQTHCRPPPHRRANSVPLSWVVVLLNQRRGSASTEHSKFHAKSKQRDGPR